MKAPSSGPPASRQETVLRWLKFNAVGGMGIGVQLLTLAALKSGLHLNYASATALAVEAAILHNFFWHERFTWADRGSLGWKQYLLRLTKFNLTTGAFSILGNLVFMRLFVDAAHIHYLIANLLTVASCSVINFFMTDRLVFSTAKASPKLATATLGRIVETEG